MSEHMIPIPSRLYNAAVGGHVAGADQIIDDKTGLTLDKIAGGALEEKTYTSSSDNGMGRVVLRKNLVEGVNTLTQSMINKSNTIYVIQYDFTLGEDITIPENCILEFDGGRLSNASGNSYTLTGNNTIINSPYTDDYIVYIEMLGTFDKNDRKSSSSSIYIIETERFGITEGYFEKGQDGHYTSEQYTKMYNNCIGFTRAFEYAYQHGFAGVVVPKGDYCITPVTSTCCIWIFNIEHLDINLNSSTFHLLVDSTQKSEYYTLTPNITYDYQCTMFFIHQSNNISIHNGVLKGDLYYRDFTDFSEANQEGCYGISYRGFITYNINISNIDGSGFSGDAINGYIGGRLYKEPVWLTEGTNSYQGLQVTTATNYGIHFTESGTPSKVNNTDFNRYALSDLIDTESAPFYINDYNEYIDKHREKRMFSIQNVSFSPAPASVYENINVLTYAVEPESADIVPLRVIPCKMFGSIHLYSKERYVRFQLALENDLAVPDGDNYDSYTLERGFTFMPQSPYNVIIDSCNIHDNGRGGISNTVNQTIVRNCFFNKVQNYNNGTTGQPWPIYNIAGTNYSIDYEDTVADQLTIENCYFYGNEASGKILLPFAAKVVFQNNTCVHCSVYAGVCYMLTSKDNNFIEGSFGSIYNEYTETYNKFSYKQERFLCVQEGNRYINSGWQNIFGGAIPNTVTRIKDCVLDILSNVSLALNHINDVVFENCNVKAYSDGLCKIPVGKANGCNFATINEKPGTYQKYMTIYGSSFIDCDLGFSNISLGSADNETTIFIKGCKNVLLWALDMTIANKVIYEDCDITIQNGQILNNSDATYKYLEFRNCRFHGSTSYYMYSPALFYGNSGERRVRFINCDFRDVENLTIHLNSLINGSVTGYLEFINPYPLNGVKIGTGPSTAVDAFRTTGTTAERPLFTPVGHTYFDTTLNKLIFKSAESTFGSTPTWVDATGTPV